MENKKIFGQFYTKNYDYILQNMKIPNNITNFIEPFSGEGDLVKFIKDNATEPNKINIDTFDIDPKTSCTIKRDTLLDPPSYKDKFVITNPPYLARNKSKNKRLFDKYNCNDLYKCFIITLMNDVCDGGIIIIPLNFISSIRKSDIDLRKNFFQIYHARIINIFEEQVFEDTSYSVCSIYFLKRKDYTNNTKLYIYPCKKEFSIDFNLKNNYTIGGEIYNIPQDEKIKIQRATKNINKNITNILLKCIDDDGYHIIYK